MRITDPRTFNSKLVTELQVDALSGILTTNYEAFVKNALKGTSTQEAPVSYGYAYLNADGVVDPALMPPLAINETYTEEATNDDSALTSLDIIKRALTENTVETVERGDIVIIYGADDITAENAEKLCGTFIFTEEVAASAVTENSYKKVYTPAGGVQTINGIPPVDGNVAIDAGDIPYLSGTVEGTLGDYNTRLDGIDADLTVIKGNDTTAGSMQYYAKQAEENAKTYTDEQVSALAAVKKFIKVDSLDPKPGSPVEDTLYLTDAGQCAIYSASGWVDISVEVITEIEEDTANDEKIASIGAIKSYIQNSVLSPINTELSKKADLVSGTVPLNQIPVLPGFDKIEDYDLHISSLAQVIQRRITVGEEFTGSMTAGTYEPNITEGNIYTLSVHTAEGNDSILRLKEYMRSKGVSEEMLKTIPEKTVWINDSGINVSVITDLQNTMPKKADKVSGAVENNLAGLDAEGNLKDSGYAVSTDATLSGTNVVPTADAIKSYVDDKVAETTTDLTEVKSKAIQITALTHQWADGDKSGQTYTWTTPGRVIQVCDASGWVLPGVQFSGGDDAISSTITVEMETASGTVTGETWTYYIASTLA